MDLDPADLSVRVNAFDRITALHHDCRPNSVHDHLMVMLADAELLYRWFTGRLSGLPAPAVALVILAGPPFEQGDPAPDTEGAPAMAVTMTDTQKVTLEVSAVDAEGHLTDLPADLTWSVDNEDAITLEVDADNPGRVTAYAGAPGVATVTITAGGITGAEAFTVTAGPAQTFNIGSTVPEEGQPTPAGGGDTPPVDVPPVDVPPVDVPPVDGGGDTPPIETGGDDTPPTGDGGSDLPPAGGDDSGSGDTGGDTTPPTDTPVEGGDTGTDTPPAGDTGSDDQPLPPVS